MKKYIKPSIEEVAVGAEYHIVESTTELPGGDYPGDGTQGAPGRKGSYVDDLDEEEDTGFGW